MYTEYEDNTRVKPNIPLNIVFRLIKMKHKERENGEGGHLRVNVFYFSMRKNCRITWYRTCARQERVIRGHFQPQ